MEVGPLLVPRVQHVEASRVPDERDEQARGLLAPQRGDARHRNPVRRMEPVEPEQARLRRRDVGGGDGLLHVAGRGNVAWAIPEDRHALEVVPRPRVAVAAGDVVRLLRDDLELSAAVEAGSSVDPDQLLTRKRAGLVDEVGVSRGPRHRGRRCDRRRERHHGEEPEEPPPHAWASGRHGSCDITAEGNTARNAGSPPLPGWIVVLGAGTSDSVRVFM